MPATEARELEEYRSLIYTLIETGADRRISNGRPLHASILLEMMFRKAKAVIRIFSGDLDLRTYGRWELTDAARAFVARPGNRLRILLQHRHPDSWLNEHPLIKALRPLAGNSANMGALEVAFAQGSYAGEEAKHFAVMDDRAYRFEHDHDGTKAIANFNEPGVAAQLVSAFDAAFVIAGNPAMVLP